MVIQMDLLIPGKSLLDVYLCGSQHSSPQCKLGYRPTISRPNPGRCTLTTRSNSSSCYRCSELYHQARLGSSFAGVHHEHNLKFNSQQDTQSFPVIVALETSASTGLSARANSLHAILHSKHTSLLNTRYIVSARASFDYQKKLCAGPVQGYYMQPIPTALLQRWYSLVREKRASRQDFLKALVKVFDVNSALKSSQVPLHFLSFVIK